MVTTSSRRESNPFLPLLAAVRATAIKDPFMRLVSAEEVVGTFVSPLRLGSRTSRNCRLMPVMHSASCSVPHSQQNLLCRFVENSS